MKTIIKSRIQWPSLLGVALIGLRLGVGDLKAQTTVPNLQTAVEGTQTAQDLKIQQFAGQIGRDPEGVDGAEAGQLSPAGDPSPHNGKGLSCRAEPH